ncbi:MULTISPECIES: protein-glutamate O-methyltransferase CheR [unclassified Clostridium]|uniref:CheR family methyltransferase n=1 Tax=unclassified Clostridium TaxID=2614128 RepID=UPI000298361B|nr:MULTISPECIES: protein-glutamate O-methyltransferase CheR [unclassified Clostridium]EKQ55079.1 MAG: methylase of chemotaxis methyl-accepting protein [Clostridium sp. Maddingley MBC34-26]
MINISEKEFAELTKFLKNNYGINLTHKKNLVESRLNNVLIEKGFTSFRQYLDYVFSDITQSELTTLINKLTTNHTFFMRENEHFQFFKNKVLPYLSTTVRDKDLRIWSAGCSSGEEAYTLAMIMQDYFSEESSSWDKKILASDISIDVLNMAEEGMYDINRLEKVSQSWKLNYFNNVDNKKYKINSKLKKEVIFRLFNLMDDFPFRKKFHVIFCRNVMIYFDKETKEKLIKKFYDATEAGGYLFIGLSETLNKTEIPYEYVMPSVYKKV